MKKFILLFFIVHCTLIIGHCQSSWFCQNPIPCAGNLLNTFALDANTIFAVGGGGTIVKTTNGGTNWVSQASGTTSWFNGVSFTNENSGTVVGYGELY